MMQVRPEVYFVGHLGNLVTLPTSCNFSFRDRACAPVAEQASHNPTPSLPKSAFLGQPQSPTLKQSTSWGSDRDSLLEAGVRKFWSQQPDRHLGTIFTVY